MQSVPSKDRICIKECGRKCQGGKLQWNYCGCGLYYVCHSCKPWLQRSPRIAELPQSAAAVAASFLVQAHIVYSWDAHLKVEDTGLTSHLNLPVGIEAFVKKEQRERKKRI